MQLEVLCLPENPELIDQCVDLLNSQWPRSKTARLRSLQQGSKESLPTSLILIELKDGKKHVIGHCKISPVPYKRDICFVESVVVLSSLRGLGLGRFIMEKTEDYVKSKGIKTIYLTTYDKQDFYEHLGYTFCDSIQLYGGGSPSFLKFIENQSEARDVTSETSSVNIQAPVPLHNIVDLRSIPPPAPPPPPPPIGNVVSPRITNGIISNSSSKFTMKKILHEN